MRFILCKTVCLGGSLLVAILMSSCTVGPDYEKPALPTPDAWHYALGLDEPEKATAPIQAWWELFEDPVLNQLIEQAEASNLTAQIAYTRVREARSRLAYTGAQNLPEVEAFAEATSTKLSDNGALSQVKPAGGFEPQGMMVFGLDAAWEIDVFGRIRREVEAEGALFEASIESYRDVMVSLYAEVALAYIEIRSSQAHIHKARQNVDVQTKTLELTEERFRDGLTSALDVEQAKSNLYATRAAIPVFRLRMNTAYNRLAVLCDDEVGSLKAQIGDASALPKPQMDIALGVPADLMRQRPDVRRAEREVAAANAQVGAATAELYPRFALSGAIGLESRSAGELFDSSSVIWTMAAPVHWNVFTAGRTLDLIDMRNDATDGAILNYRETVLEAIEEVQNALVGISENRTRLDLLNQATRATSSAVELVTTQYENGLTDFNNVLDMQRALYRQENHLVTSQTDELNSIVALYKALGGGWDANATLPLKDEVALTPK